MLGNVLAKFSIATGKYEFVESIFGGSGPPSICDKEGDLFFALSNYTYSLIEYSPSSRSFTNYWTGLVSGTPEGIEGLAVDSMDQVWFVTTYFNETQAEFGNLYRLSRGGSGTTITTTVSANSTQTEVSTYPSDSLTYTSSLASTIVTPVSTITMTQSTSTLGVVSTMTVTQTLAVQTAAAKVSNTASSANTSTSTTPSLTNIGGFPVESIAGGVVAGLVALMILRNRKRLKQDS